ncbi:hypothetical protein [Sphingomonas sp. PAMC 26621]|uniref:hypothetical protein n=1 Tax=Sphingomonas sp. PAMC 26621 TaxID=1112213 RepID=UPI000474F583|nr:hypothetical protein [Sphingomonas sp. PAMC 26621]
MSEPMTLDRFRDLADAYGGAIARWPEQHRDAAALMAVRPCARKILAYASTIDETLDVWRVPSPSVELRNDVVGSALAQKKTVGMRARLWWSAVGVAAALAGAASGTAAVAMVAPIDSTGDSGTSFGDIGAQDN